MSQTIRIGLIAEGEAELGTSVPYIYNPKQGGTVIERDQEGALHTLIRRELAAGGFPDCAFVHRHPTPKDNVKYRMGYSVVTDRRYLAQTIIAWRPEEIDMIVIVVDEDGKTAEREKQLKTAQEVIVENFLDQNDQPVLDRHSLGLAIKNFDTWLLADVHTLERFLQTSLPTDLPDDLESLPADNQSDRNAKLILENTIHSANYTPVNPRVSNHLLEARWAMAALVNLDEIKQRCQNGYALFVKSLLQVSGRTLEGMQS